MTSVVAVILILTAGRPAPDRGKEVYDTVCSSCHTLTPPPLSAPPLLMVVGHYVQGTGSEDAAREAMMQWIPAPDTARSLLPDHAVTRFGQMAPLTLSDGDIEAVVAYLFTEWNAAEQPEPHGPACEGEHCGQGMQMHHGMMMHHGMQPDTSHGAGMMMHHGMQPDTSHGAGMMMRHGMQPDTSHGAGMMMHQHQGACAACSEGAGGCSGGMCRKAPQEGDAAPQGQGMQMRHGMMMHQAQDSMATGHQCPHMQEPRDGQDQ